MSGLFFLFANCLAAVSAHSLGSLASHSFRHQHKRTHHHDANGLTRAPGWVPGNLQRDMLGGEIYTYETFTYGRFEVSFQISDVSGTLTTFFLYKPESETQNCQRWANDCHGASVPQCWQELDVEVFGRDKGNAVSTNVILRQAQNREMMESLVPTPGAGLSNGFHTYAMEWTPQGFKWLLDGRVIRDETHGDCHAPSLFTEPMGLRLNFWSCTDPLASWCGAFDWSGLPAVGVYDWARYSSWDPATGNFVQQWQDDFNTLDTSRWGVADWTFGENRVQFSPTQVVTGNGRLAMYIDSVNNVKSGAIPQSVYNALGVSNAPAPAPASTNTNAFMGRRWWSSLETDEVEQPQSARNYVMMH